MHERRRPLSEEMENAAASRAAEWVAAVEVLEAENARLEAELCESHMTAERLRSECHQRATENARLRRDYESAVESASRSSTHVEELLDENARLRDALRGVFPDGTTGGEAGA